MCSRLGLGPTNFTMHYGTVQWLLGKASLLILKLEKFLELCHANILTSLCYRESQVGRVYLLLGTKFESI